MARSNHRYTSKEGTPMVPTTSLHDLIVRFERHMAAVGRADGTRSRYAFTFKHFERFCEEQGVPFIAGSLTTSTLEHFAIWLRETPIREQKGKTQRSASGIHAHLRDMRAFCRWLYEEELIAKPVKVTLPKLPKRLFRILDDEEMGQLWQSKYLTGTSTLAIRNRAMVALMLDTGIRREEAANICLSDLSLERKTLTVIGKGDKERRVFFSNRVRDLLKEFLAIRGMDDEPLFHLTADGIRTQFRRIKEDVGLEAFHPHLLRHQFATSMLRETKSLEYVRLLLGHEDYNTTKQYLSLADADLQQAHEAASPFDTLVPTKEAPPPKRRVRYTKQSA